MIKRDNDVELAAQRAREKRVTRLAKRKSGMLRAEGPEGRIEQVALLVTEQPALPGVRIESAHPDARLRDALDSRERVGRRDRAMQQMRPEQTRDLVERHMPRRQHQAQFAAAEIGRASCRERV